MSINKSRYWCAVLYNENMLEDWKEEIGDIVQLPYAYCVHDKDKDDKKEGRKVHTHIILAFSNTTTYNHAMKVFSLLSAPGKVALNKIQAVISIRSAYDYLIHDTETAKKKGKYQYDLSERITGNNFDIGSFEQVSIAEKDKICIELAQMIRKDNFQDFGVFYFAVMDKFNDRTYFEILKANSGFFERLTKSNFQKAQREKEAAREALAAAESAEYRQAYLDSLGRVDQFTGEILD